MCEDMVKVKIFARQGNYTQVDNYVIDTIMGTLTGAEFKVLMAIIRKTVGWGKGSDHISYSQLEQLCGIGRTSVSAAIKSLVQREVIVMAIDSGYPSEFALNTNFEADIPVQKVNGGGSESERGGFRKCTPTRSESEPTKDTSSKKTFEETKNINDDDVFADVYGYYESNIVMSPGSAVASALAEWLDIVPADWIKKAIDETAMRGIRNWRYVEKILDTWHRQGYVSDGAKQKTTQADDSVGGYYV